MAPLIFVITPSLYRWPIACSAQSDVHVHVHVHIHAYSNNNIVAYLGGGGGGGGGGIIHSGLSVARVWLVQLTSVGRLEFLTGSRSRLLSK